MKRFLVILLILPLFVSGQHLGPFIKYYKIEQVKKKLEKIILEESALGITYKLEKFGDTLYYTEITKDFTTKMKLTFNLKYDYCDYQEVATTCSDCAEKRQNDLFKIMKFYKISDTKYFSKYSRRIELETLGKTDQKFCSIVRLKYISLTRKEYKKKIESYNSEN